MLSAVLVGNIFEILQQTGLIARAVLGILLFFSLVSWALILQKLGIFGRIRRQSDQFLRIFRATKGVANPQGVISAGSPFANVYAAGYRELQTQVTGEGNNPHPKIKSFPAITVSMQLAAADEIRRVEKGMSWLATTAGVTPFIGLFGTVWGIIDAFSGLGSSGAASLRAVAPGIAEALVTTAFGLLVAVPAVWAYNYFTNKVEAFDVEMDNSSMELINYFILRRGARK